MSQASPLTNLEYPCVKCGLARGVSLERFRTTYTPRWALFGLPLGIIGLKLLFWGQVTHDLAAPFCSPCGQRLRTAPVVSLASLIVSVTALMGGMFLGIRIGSWVPLALGTAAAVGVAAWAGRHDRSVYPRYRRVDQERVVIEVPGQDPIELTPDSWPP